MWIPSAVWFLLKGGQGFRRVLHDQSSQRVYQVYRRKCDYDDDERQTKPEALCFNQSSTAADIVRHKRIVSLKFGNFFGLYAADVQAMRQVPLERDINIAVNGCSGFATYTRKGPFTARDDVHKTFAVRGEGGSKIGQFCRRTVHKM